MQRLVTAILVAITFPLAARSDWTNDGVFTVVDAIEQTSDELEQRRSFGLTSGGADLVFRQESESLRKSLAGQKVRIYARVKNIRYDPKLPRQPAAAVLDEADVISDSTLREINLDTRKTDITAIRRGSIIRIDGVIEDRPRRFQQQTWMHFMLPDPGSSTQKRMYARFFVIDAHPLNDREYQDWRANPQKRTESDAKKID